MDQTGKTMQGKTCIITGATSGIGKETARALSAAGARVVIVSRNPQKCAATANEIKADTGNAQVEFIPADLTSKREVRRLAKEILDRYPQVNVLINNAGGVFSKRQESAEGVEVTWALNVVAPFLLTNLLLKRLEESAPSRVVNVSSAAHKFGKMRFDDLEGKKRYRGFRAYGQSKLALLLFTYELTRRLDGRHVTVNAVHPGLVRTGFGMNNKGALKAGVRLANSIRGLTPREGAETVIYLATSQDVDGASGRYFFRKRAVQSSKASYDEASASRLWEILSTAANN